MIVVLFFRSYNNRSHISFVTLQPKQNQNSIEECFTENRYKYSYEHVFHMMAIEFFFCSCALCYKLTVYNRTNRSKMNIQCYAQTQESKSERNRKSIRTQNVSQGSVNKLRNGEYLIECECEFRSFFLRRLLLLFIRISHLFYYSCE